jgi:nickel-type superoxide dismutase maturation protease
MKPTLLEGQEVLVKPSRPSLSPKPGQLILVRHPMETQLTMIKRCSYIENNLVFVHGDNPTASTDSRQFGGVRAELVLGYVQCTFP